MNEFIISDIENAILKGQKSIVLHSVYIDLPGPQTAGTYTQKVAYARQEAERIYNEIVKLKY